MKGRKRKQGQALPLAAILAFVLVMIGLGFIGFSFFFGGAQEIKNAVDACCLNVGKQLLDNVSVTLTSDPGQQCFQNVTSDYTNPSQSTDGKVTLRRINRVWGEALLMAINADAATTDGTLGSMADNATTAFNGAQAISNSLAGLLTTPSNLEPFFNQFAGFNSVRMLGAGSSVTPVMGANWQTSLMSRQLESNIVLTGNPGNSFGMPPNYTLNSSYYTQCTRNPIPSQGTNLWFLKGYVPLNANGQTFWLVPFQYDEKPYLVSRTDFENNQQPPNSLPATWSQPVPNAYSVEGKTVKAGSPSAPSESAVSWVLTNPREPFQLAMPHSFMHIKLDQMVANFYFFPTGVPPIQFGSSPSYGYTTDSVTGDPMPFGGVFCSLVDPGSVTVGLDVVGDSVDGVIFGSPAGNTSALEAYMVNRINEMCTVVGVTKTAADLHNCLSDPATIGELASGSFTDFYVYSPDGQNLSCKPQALAIAEAPWLASEISNDPDGTANAVINDTSTAAPYYFTPTPTPIICFTDDGLDFGTEWWHKTVNWTPGSGFNGNLGLVEVTRWTDVDSLCICIYSCG